MAKVSAGKTRQAEKAQAVTHPILTLSGLEDAALWEELIQEASAVGLRPDAETLATRREHEARA
jgi:hypothetical protein